MTSHFKYLKKMSAKSVYVTKRDFKKLIISPTYNPENPEQLKVGVLIDIREEDAKIAGNEYILTRLFARCDDSKDLVSVGWVSNSSTDKCMVCVQDFSSFGGKHHCRTCGNLVCNKCHDMAKVRGMERYGLQRVCRQCNWGQEPVDLQPNDEMGQSVKEHIQNTKHGSRDRTKQKENEREAVEWLKKFGKTRILPLTPGFVIKAQPSKGGLPFYVNICTSEGVPFNPESGEEFLGEVVYLVCGPVEEVENRGARRPAAVCDIVVNPKVLEMCDADFTGSNKIQLSEQALICICQLRDQPQFVSYKYYHTPHDYVHPEDLDDRGSLCSTASSTFEDPMVLARNRVEQEFMGESPVMAIPPPMVFKRLGQVVSERNVPAEFDQNPASHNSFAEASGQNMSMVHRIMQRGDSVRIPVLRSEENKNPMRSTDSVTVDPGPLDHGKHTVKKSSRKAITVIPNPGFVIKTKRPMKVTQKESHGWFSSVQSSHNTASGEGSVGSGSLGVHEEKVFINVLHHASIDQIMLSEVMQVDLDDRPFVLVGEMGSVNDKTGQKSVLFNVVVPTEHFKNKYRSHELKISEPRCVKKIITTVNKYFNESLNLDEYTLPKVKGRVKGNVQRVMTFYFNTSEVAVENAIKLANDLAVTQAMRNMGLTEPIIGPAGTDRDPMDFHQALYISSNNPSAPDPAHQLRRSSVASVNSMGSSVSEITNDMYGNESIRSGVDGNIFKPSGGRRFSLFGGGEDQRHNIEGQKLLSGDMTVFLKELSVDQDMAEILREYSSRNPNSLLGWQVLVADNETQAAIYVVTELRKNKWKKTEFRISNMKMDDRWVRLKRSTKKTGLTFWPLRKVLFLDQVNGRASESLPTLNENT